jgi:alpha-1,2-glucosyltransferase
MIFAFAAAIAFASIRRALAPAEEPYLSTAQFVFFPILFPYCFVLYTDVPSLALVLWALRASLDRRHVTAGALGTASLLVRQTNVLWIAFMALLRLVELPGGRAISRKTIVSVASLWPYGLAIAATFAFWLWNGMFSMSPRQAYAHPELTMHAGNLFFMLFLLGILFLPLIPIWLARYAAAAKRQPWLLLIPLLLVLTYLGAFRADHPYNQTLPDYVLRNRVLLYVSHHGVASAIFCTVAATAGAALSQVRWQRDAFALLLPAAMLFVSIPWLVETRYYLIPVGLLLATRQSEDCRAEWAMLCYWMPLAFVAAYGMLDFRFYV